MAGMNEMADVNEALKGVAGQARAAWERFAAEVELDRRLRETPMLTLGVAAAAGLVLGGGLWPLLRPFVRTAARAALSPTNLLAIGAAIGALRASGGMERSAPVSGEGGSGAH